MTRAENETILRYFENVLGVSEVLLRNREVPQVQEKQYLVIHLIDRAQIPNDENSENQALLALMHKMLEALSWTAEKVKVIEMDPSNLDGLSSLTEQQNFLKGIVFADDPESIQNLVSPWEVVTSPRLLNQKPDLKRAVWNQIKYLKDVRS